MTEFPQTGEVLPPGPPPEPRTSGAAIASLVLGILAFCTFGLTGIPGVILGLVGLRSVRRGRGAVKGRGPAIAGIVTSAVGLLLWLIALVLIALVPFVLSALLVTRHAAQTRIQAPHVVARAASTSEMAAQSMIGMKVLADAARAFAEEHGGRLPTAEEFAGGLEPYFKQEPRPAAPQGRAFAMNEALAGARLADIANPDRTVLFFETCEGGDGVGGRETLRPLDGPDDAYVVALADGHVAWVPKEEIDQFAWEPQKVTEFLRL
jgi:hypothetical protein